MSDARRPPPVWGSDLMADAIRATGIRYLSLNPGSSYRGLHDSLVNWLDNEILMIESPHEKVAVGIAHGFAKVAGEPMGVILHNVVGLLHGTMGIYYAYLDRVPVLVFGGSGPAALDRRRPEIDWIHSANVQGNAVRDYTKWDHEPRSLASVQPTIERAYRVARSEPAGPVYIALDAGLQEDAIDPADAREVSPRKVCLPSRIAPDPNALSDLAARLVAAHRPIIVAGYAGRDPAAFSQLQELAETLGAGVVDSGIRLNFPNRHPLCVTETNAIDGADCILFVDVKGMGKATQESDPQTRKTTPRIQPGTIVLDIGFNDLGLSSWSEDYAERMIADVQVTADTVVALPMLIELCKSMVETESHTAKARRGEWRRDMTRRHDAAWTRWASEARAVQDLSPVSTARLAADTWDVVKHHDWVLTAGTAGEWAKRLWDFDRPYRHPGRQLGTATQIGISLGVALAHRGTGRLVVDLQPDGDLMFDAGALWVASYYELPLLVIMFNNRAYYNDWAHQEHLARFRGTPVQRASIGMEIDNPAPDFAALARSFGWYAEGPIDEPSQLREAIQRAADHVLEQGMPALVDVVCQPK